MGRRPLVSRDEPPADKPTAEECPAYVGGFLDGERIKLLYRAADGSLRVKQHAARFASYHRFDPQEPGHVAALRQLRNSRHVTRVLDEGEWTRAEWRDYDARDKGVAWLEGQGVHHWEADLSPIKRHFADTDDRTSASPRIAYLDIETDSRVKFSEKEKMRVVCWTVVDGHAEGGAVWWSGMLEEDSDKDEARVLEELWEVLRGFDVVSAWYGGSDRPDEGFDFPVIRARSKRMGLGIDFRRWRWVDQLDVFKKMNAHVASSGDEKQSMSLQNICQSVLGEGKNEFDASQTWQEWEAGGERRAKLLSYNQQDTMLLRKLEAKTGYLALFSTICAASNLFVESKSLGVHQQMDGSMLRLGRQRGYHWPTKPKPKGDGSAWVVEKVKGAYVMEAPEKAGILKNVHVIDFSGMYPSIMLTWNMSPETLRQVVDGRPVATCPLTHSSFYTDHEGILPASLKNDREMRKQWSKKKASLTPNTPEWEAAERWAMGYKVMANSKYGGTGLVVGRYYMPRVTEGTTQNGKWLIQRTMAEGAKDWGLRAIYGDTDSAMAQGATEEQVHKFVAWCNAELYPKMVAECGCRENYIAVDYEKAYERIVFCASKKYCARILHYKGKRATAESKPEIKGLEFKRGDAVKMARLLQGTCIDRLMRDCCEDPMAFEPDVKRCLNHCLNDSLMLEEVVLGKSLSKPIKEYAATTPPIHVRVAKLLQERGEDVSVGQKVMYVITNHDVDEGGSEAIPANDWTGELDRYGLWEHLVWPPTRRLLESAFPQHDWAQFDKVRPKAAPKLRSSKKREGQLALIDPDAGKVLRLVASEEAGFNERGVAAARTILGMARDGGTPVELTLRLGNGDVQMVVDRRVTVDDVLVRRLRSLLGDSGVQW